MTRPGPKIYASRHGRIRLVGNRRTGTLIYQQSGGNQSAVDRHGISLDSYIHALYAMALQTKARKVLIVGCAGGALATMLHRAGLRVTVVDIDPVAIAIARRHFHLPQGVRAVVGDGVAYMRSTRARFDLVVVDAFVGESIPAAFKTDMFARAARRCTARAGALFVNVCLAGYKDRSADAMAGLLADNGWTVRLIDQRGPDRNAIVLAGRVAEIERPRPLVMPEHDIYGIRAILKGMRFRPVARPPALS